MNKRIKELREYLKMSRSAFGERLGVSGDVVNNLERGRVEIKEDRIKLICSVFNINEDWLRYGTGKMSKSLTKNQEIGAFANDVMKLPDEAFKKRFVEALKKLDEKDWENIEKIVNKLMKED